MSDPTDLTTTEAADAIARGLVTSEQLVEACLARIEEREGEINAWAHLDPDHARSQARAADAARRSGMGVGPLHGVPVGIKDIIDTADQPTENGSPIFKGRRPQHDAACVAALRAAGAVILGKTVTTELATFNPAATRNPVNTAHTPGGSSSGSAAAVACGMVPAALATQTGGSIIRPASFCGIYGFKPTFGLISRRGVLMQSSTLDTVGVYGRSVEDVALLADCLAGHDPADEASYPRSRPSLLSLARSQPPLPPIFALVKSPGWGEAWEVTREAFAELAALLGGSCEEVEMPTIDIAADCAKIVYAAENASFYGPLLKHHGDRLSPGTRERLEAGQKIGAKEYIDALRSREEAYGVVDELLTNVSAIITPAAPGPAPASLASTGSPVFNGVWTYLGTPAVTLPLLEADGMPMGVQLIGKRRDDGRLLRTARWLVGHLAQA